MSKRNKEESNFEEEIIIKKEREKKLDQWIPNTELGKKVKNGEISSIDEIFDNNLKIKEPEIVDILIPNLQQKQIDIKKTARVTSAGRKLSFRVSVIVGDGDKYIGLGTAKDKEKWPATNKASKKAKLNLVRVKKGCGSWECNCDGFHSIPFKVDGKCSSVRVTLLPAPKGVGLVAGDAIKDVFRMVGIKDVWVKTKGNTRSTLEFVAATIDALSKTAKMRRKNE
ncbi:MAG: 30S ribosomal protein S5 [Candidatus Diapherotrites archaeon]|nr:30S ribosomal protein S5 [Candidatus Diapherotrites archaeon]